MCLTSRNGSFDIDGSANLAQVCLELTGGAYRARMFSRGNSQCSDYDRNGWNLLESGDFDKVTVVECNFLRGLLRYSIRA